MTEAKAASDGSTANLPSTSMFESFFGAQAPTLISPKLRDMFDQARSYQLRADDASPDFDPDALADMLEQKVFTDANHIGDGVYRIPASLACGEPVDADCAADFAKLDLRVRVANDDDALVFFVQIDKNHDEPLSFSLSHERLAATVDLDEASDAINALQSQSSSPAKLAGAVTGSLTIVGAKHAKLAVDFDRALAIEAEGAKFTSAVAHVLAIDLDGNAKKAGLSIGLGETTAHIPGDELDPQARDIDLAGLSVDASFDGTTLSLGNISLGNKTSTVKVNGQQALAVDLNANDGRKLSATLANDTLTVSPRFDLQIAMNRALLGAEDAPYDITRVQLDGSLSGDDTGRMKVVTGSFSMTTNPAEYGFSAAAGQCVAPGEVGFVVETCN